MQWLMPLTTVLQILTIVFPGSCADFVSPKSAWPTGTVAILGFKVVYILIAQMLWTEIPLLSGTSKANIYKNPDM